ncbi:MAG: DUF2267 domain-containing protein [Mesorhizobium sp.]|uniref:DUF2267 domain-containing protein n=1 Tax=Mesorhizobium TaxID=68287 RepID=UPI0003CE0883|nr:MULTISPECIES: DUF2267 domain-containing protein [Mesorhizobium]ESY67409.1 hypothetical protein X742_13900 [Mesorhizobium sp. LNHC232B00]TJU94350.1 MAG: DUF2267 domain-containing protein [Mesorhizobium sp.]WJI36232.1 DUF2267 domain-containing protein [Mesorhizobium opportunistum]
MTATGLDVIDKTVQTTNIWLNEIMDDLGPDRQFAWHVLGVVLRALRDRLPAELGANLGAELPLLIRGAYYDQYQPSDVPSRDRTVEEFVHRIAEALKSGRPVNAGEATRTVFKTLAHHVDLGQSAKVRDALPKGVQALWPDSVGA